MVYYFGNRLLYNYSSDAQKVNTAQSPTVHVFDRAAGLWTNVSTLRARCRLLLSCALSRRSLS